LADTKEAEAYLSVRMQHRIGALKIDVDFELTKPWTILFGPSGSGKTTILRAIVGLVKPDQAFIKRNASEFRGRTATTIVLDDSDAKEHLAPWYRSLGFAPQQPSLFPHMAVFENIAYGFRHVPHGEDELGLLKPILELFDITQLSQKYPAQLSGGEAQRVNLARALATTMSSPPLNSRLLLLDEPFTGLEQGLRDEVISGLETWLAQRQISVLSVTHDVAEAFLLDAEVIKIAEGRVVRQGPVASVLAEERTRLLEQLSPSE
jgi:molybdate transport system ATP-binding protein